MDRIVLTTGESVHTHHCVPRTQRCVASASIPGTQSARDEHCQTRYRPSDRWCGQSRLVYERRGRTVSIRFQKRLECVPTHRTWHFSYTNSVGRTSVVVIIRFRPLSGAVPMTLDSSTNAATTTTMSATLDRAGFTRAQFWVMMLILAGMFFDTLEQNSVGAMGSNIKASLGIDNAHLTAINTATVLGGLLGRFFGGWLADRWGRRSRPGPEPGHLQHRRTDQRHRPELRGPPGQPADRGHRPRRRVHDRHRDDVGDGRDPLPGDHRLDLEHRIRRCRQLHLLRPVLPAARPAGRRSRR